MRMLLLLILAPIAALAGDSPRQQLQSFLADLHTLQASFDQQVIDTENNQVSHASGQLYVKRPGRFLWEYEGDYPRYIVADGRTIWLVETDLEQVSQRSQKAALKGTPAALLAEQLDLDQEFRVEELGTRQGIGWLKLVPRDEQSQFEQILLGFQGGRLARLEMADRFGQVTSFSFSAVQKNIPLAESLFRFVPPPGYDILDQ